MKKYIGIFVLLLMFFVSTPTAKAYSLDDLYASIQSLQQQVSGLYSQISATALKAVTTLTPTSVSAPVITKGTRNAEVMKIQSALKVKGYFLGAVTGYYGDRTAEAVSAFQLAKGFLVTGTTINNTTKTAILSVTTASPVSATPVTTVSKTLPCVLTTQPWIKVLSPNGGETYTAGQSLKVTWTSCNIPTTESVLIEIVRANTINVPIGPWVVLSSSTPNDGIQTFTLNTSITSGQYELAVKRNSLLPGDDISDNLFTINATTPTSPALSVVPYFGKCEQAGLVSNQNNCNILITIQNQTSSNIWIPINVGSWNISNIYPNTVLSINRLDGTPFNYAHNQLILSDGGCGYLGNCSTNGDVYLAPSEKRFFSITYLFTPNPIEQLPTSVKLQLAGVPYKVGSWTTSSVSVLPIIPVWMSSPIPLY